jgi:hypothetical protein
VVCRHVSLTHQGVPRVKKGYGIRNTALENHLQNYVPFQCQTEFDSLEVQTK